MSSREEQALESAPSSLPLGADTEDGETPMGSSASKSAAPVDC